MVIGEIAKVDSTSQVVSLKKPSAVSASLNFNFLQMVNFCNIYGQKKLSNSCFQWHTYFNFLQTANFYSVYKGIIEKSRGEVSLVEQDSIRNDS